MGELKNKTASLFFCHLFDVPLLSFSSFPLVSFYSTAHERVFLSVHEKAPAYNSSRQRETKKFVPSSHGIKKQRGRLAGQFIEFPSTEYSDVKKADLDDDES